MSIALYRIDDRLVHGQVMTAWARIFNITKIIVVDDATAKNNFLCDVMKMAVPSGCSVQILTIQDAVAVIQAVGADEKAIVLVKAPAALRALLDLGIVIKEINVGNVGAGPGRKAVMRSTQLSKDEFDTLVGMSAQGIHVYFQMLPEAKSMELEKLKF
jgi:mannose/fructose/N-acetylgalactosamine-specific phosphotransferase system component IIB